ncbi:MFS transporter [Aestuariimicrobium kwangyangense]|uniref:MFS transporter n=1 Tax=Aestuariimicrobium kwangyangense TaxID=396389 RepID=UPI0003B4B2DE|nr:MFS transporter [Aestuariimicrobium kwangyangense]
MSQPSRALSSAAAGLWGLHFAFLTPALAFILVALLDMTPTQMGTVLAISNAGGFVAAIVLPAWADRTRQYPRFLIAAVLCTLALVAVLASTTSLPVVVAALVVLGGPAGTGMSMLYGHLRAAGTPARSIVHTRTMVSLAWIIGPPVATFLISGFGNDAILWALALVAVGNLATTVLLMREHARSASPAKAPDDHLDLPRLIVALIMVAFVLMQAANAAGISVMNLHVVDSLGLSLWWAGLALGLAAALEVPALLWLGRLTARWSSLGLLVSGAIASIAYYPLMALAQGPVVLLGSQVLNAWGVATMSGVGITLFQQMIPSPGLAAGLMTNTRRIGTIVSGGLIAVAAGGLRGYRTVFLGCGLLAVLGLVILLVAVRHTRRRVVGASSRAIA